MLRLNSIFEVWLREAADKPLSSWKRAALLWRLQESEELRCYAAELAQFCHESEPAKHPSLSQAEQTWMRQRLRARILDESTSTAPREILSWAGPAVGLALGLTVLALVLWVPQKGPGPNDQAAPLSRAEALAHPSPTSTPTPNPEFNVGDAEVKATGPFPTLTAAP